MDLTDAGHIASSSLSLLRFPDDRSDSGVSSLRSGSGDERSGSRSSALSLSDEPQPPLTTTTSSSSSSSSSNALFFTANNPSHAQSLSESSVRVWRDPSLLLVSEPHVRHVNSVQHQTLLMSHPSTPAASGPPPTSTAALNHAGTPLYQAVAGPPSSSSSQQQQQQPALMSPHPLQQHLAPPGALYPHHLPDMLWKPRYSIPSHLITSQAGGHPVAGTDEMIERERAYAQDRLLRDRQNQEVREMEKHQHKEREQKERERMERDKMEREREKQEKDQERERQEKQRAAEQAVHKHFEESLRRAHQKREQGSWNLILPPPQQRSSSVEEERKRRDQELHQREQQMLVMREARDRAYYNSSNQRAPGISSKVEYPPPAHSKAPGSKPNDKVSGHAQIPKAEVNVFGYPAYQPHNAFFAQEPKNKADHHKGSLQPTTNLIVTKTGVPEREHNLASESSSLLNELKNSVIVKHEVKSQQHQMDAKGNNNMSKMRASDMLGHYLPSSGGHKGAAALYEYRSPTQSPHHLQHVASPHHHMEPQNLGKSHQQQQQQQRPSPNQMAGAHARANQHPHLHQHPSPELRYRSASVSEPQTMAYPNKGLLSANFYLPPGTTVAAHPQHNANNAKPKVSSPAPHHIYGKPSGMPLVRSGSSSRGENNTGAAPTSNPLPLTSKPPLTSSVSPSPFQQMSQYHPPHSQALVSTSAGCLPPPPAHSSRSSNSSMDARAAMYDRLYPGGGGVPGGLSAKQSLMPHHGTSPPTAASAPSPIQRGAHMQYCAPGMMTLAAQSGAAVQTQPLDLGVSSSKYESATSPKRKAPTPGAANTGGVACADVKKRRMDPVMAANFHTHNALFMGAAQQQPQLARVSEPSPLIASAATTITTVVNTAAYHRPPSAGSFIHQSHVTASETLADVSVSAVSVSSESASNAKTNNNAETVNNDSLLAATTHDAATASPSPAFVILQPAESPHTPIKPALTPTPSTVDSDKSNSPGPATKVANTAAAYPVRHLKKAWLQRHTGEDLEETLGVTGGGGSCVTLPLNLNVNNVGGGGVSAPLREACVSLHSVGSMAVNSISKVKTFASKGSRKGGGGTKDTSTLNGDATKAADDSSSSDAERGRKSPPKRKPPKVKRKKGGGGAGAVQKKLAEEQKKRKNNQTAVGGGGASESSESDKESGSEKDSDSGASATTVASIKKVPTTPPATTNTTTTTTSNSSSNTSAPSKEKEPRKRGRRPKTSKNDKGEEPRTKRSKDDDPLLPQRDPFRKPPVGQLKKTGESFLQDGPCFEVAPKLAKCRECRWTPNQRSKNMPNIFCRFYAFRRLRYTKNGQLAIAGFSDPHKDAMEDDIKLWLPTAESPPADLDLETSRFILKQVGDHFCDLLVQEKEAHNQHMSDDKVVAWKRVVQGVREMCDVCETTLFNFHWACGKCGFVVCLDCYKSRKNGTIKIWGEGSQKDRDDFSWLLCTNRQPHEQEKLMLTQIIAGDSLLKLGKLVHEVRELWNIEQYCSCPISKEVSSKTNGTHKDIIQSILTGETNGLLANGTATLKSEFPSLLGWLADVALSHENKKQPAAVVAAADADEDNHSRSSVESTEEKPSSTLRELLTNGSQTPTPPTAAIAKLPKKGSGGGGGGQIKVSMDDVLSTVIDESATIGSEIPDTKMELKHFVRRYNWHVKGRTPLPYRLMTVTESKTVYPDVPHNWLCDGKLLLLYDSNHNGNYKIFQDQWKRGQPVVVSDVARLLSKDLWNPEAFTRDFGDEKNDLVNCLNGKTLPNQPMRRFWEGFEYFAKRLKDDKGNPMLLKLKDWPPGEDFAELLPSRYNDLMKVLPLAEYTQRTGRLNLASRLPDCFVRPDLGPKMYNAYGSALHPTKGTTNLHLDISDAVNVMVYVGIPKDGNGEEHIKEAFRAIDQAGCDVLTRRNLRDELLKSLKGELPEALKRELPGALWHIYNARDADKIRDLLNKVVVEKGGRLEPHHDPIHDQSCYLDRPLRERLYKEYGVQGYTIVQCLGDAVFIPAGAPHQVLNLHNCIKVAEDFVSPENVAHCFHLTQEFRELSDTHSNHEDKLQIKNIIYHAVKDSLSTLMSVLNTHLIKIEREACARNGNSVADADNSLKTNSDSTEPV